MRARRSRGRGLTRFTGGLTAVALVCTAAPGAPAASSGQSTSLAATPTEVRSGEAIGLNGTLRSEAGAPLGGVPVELQIEPFPFRGFFDAGHTTSAIDGSFAFGNLHPDRNTRYRVLSAAGTSRPVTVYADAHAILHAFDRGPGRARLTMISYHSGFFRWAGVRAYWYVARPASGAFSLAAITRTRELKPGVTFASATIDPPATHFVYRVCFNGFAESGTGPPAAHARCPRGDFTVRPPLRR